MDKQKLKLEKIAPMLAIDGRKLLYGKKLYAPRKSVSILMQIGHESKIGGHFKFSKTVESLDK